MEAEPAPDGSADPSVQPPPPICSSLARVCAAAVNSGGDARLLAVSGAAGTLLLAATGTAVGEYLSLPAAAGAAGARPAYAGSATAAGG